MRTEIDSKPQALDEVDRAVMQLEIERQALQKEKDKASKERLANLEKDLANLREAGSELNARWSVEKEAIQKIRDIKERLMKPKPRSNGLNAIQTWSRLHACAMAQCTSLKIS